MDRVSRCTLAVALATAGAAAQHAPYFVGGTPIAEINAGGGNNFSPTLSEDELYMVFASDRAGAQGYDLYETRRFDVDGLWSQPIPLFQLNSQEHDYEPNLSYDGLELYFASTRPGRGSSDLYVSRRSTTTSPWGPPQNLGPQINGPGIGNDDPALVQDGLTMFFTSTGRSGSGDIFVATRGAIGQPWGNVVPFFPANGPDSDHSPMPDDAGETVWFASDRPGGASSDWYMVSLDDQTLQWSAPVHIPELSSAGWDSNGWLGGITSRMYGSAFTGPNNTSILCIWCLKKVRQKIRKCVVTRVQRWWCWQCRRWHWMVSWRWRWVWGPWRWQYYRWSRNANEVRYGLFSTHLSATGLTIPGVDGLLVLDPTRLYDYGASVLPPSGLVTVEVPFPADPNLIGLELSFQDVIVAPGFTRVELSEPARMIIDP